MKFTKMHGTGNDFIVINAMQEKLPSDLGKLSKTISDRHYGIGCDQVLIIDNSTKADFKMLIFNSDGSEVEMCGNGIRCLARYVKEKGLTDKTDLKVETLAGIIKPKIMKDKVMVDMGEPRFKTKDWIFKDKKTIDKTLKIHDKKFQITLVSVGNPHCIIFDNDLNDELVLNYGPKIENHSSFPSRINVEFIKVINSREIKMRVWERGAGETLACGTGATAACIACSLNKKTERKIIVHLKGGNLEIRWAADNHVYMTGSAEFVFEGEI